MTHPRLPDSLPADLDVTPRQVEIILACAQHDGHKEVAAELGLTENTVKNQCTRAYHRLGVTSLVGALRVLGIIRLEGADELLAVVGERQRLLNERIRLRAAIAVAEAALARMDAA